MQMRVNIRNLKQLVWLFCVLVFLFAGWTFYQIFTAKQAGEYQARKRTFYENLLTRNVAQRDTTPKTWTQYVPDRYEKLWLARVDGSIREIDDGRTGDETPEEPTVAPLPPLDTIIDVSLVLYSTDPVSRLVGIKYITPEASGGVLTDGKARRLHMAEGDPLMSPYDGDRYNGKVLEIGLQEVTFQWGDGTVTLTPGLGADGAGAPISEFEIDERDNPADDLDEAPEQSVEVRPGHWVMGTRDLESMRRDPQLFMSEEMNVRSITVPGGGRTQLEVAEVKPGSLAEQYGVLVGDRIISVNGIPMSSVSSAINWAKANPDLPEYVVVYERGGVTKTTTFYVK
jgi:membrane-associated protease RseP (regulator of RpoE activity)